ncbi:hypothetical protein Tco_1033466 [Tanacetum coccineum]
METKDTLSSCSDLDEQEIQQLQKQEKILKENSQNKFNALKTSTQRLERKTFTNCPLFQRAFSHLFHTDVRTFKYELSQNMNNLEKQTSPGKEETQVGFDQAKGMTVRESKAKTLLEDKVAVKDECNDKGSL